MEDWNELEARRMRRQTQPRVTLGFVLLTVLGFLVLGLTARLLVLPYFHEHLRPTGAPAVGGDPRAMELAHLKMLGRALRLHADEHDGKFPPSISEIQWRQTLPGMDWAGLPAAVSRFHNPETGQVSDWLYYPGHTENDPPDTILVAAPVALGKGRDRRMVVRVNGVAEIIAEADFLRPITEPAGP